MLNTSWALLKSRLKNRYLPDLCRLISISRHVLAAEIHHFALQFSLKDVFLLRVVFEHVSPRAIR